MSPHTDPVSLLPLGAIIQSYVVGGINIVQGFPTQELYSYNSPFFGETIGRVANRISGAKINSLNGGKSYPLAQNNGKNSLHGGVKGWGKLLWEGPTEVETKKVDGIELENPKTTRFTLTSKDGDEGYPGTVEVSVTYTQGTGKTTDGKDVNTLVMEYEVKLIDGADETVVNMTNHSYFNLTGGPTIEGTKVSLVTNSYLPVDDGGIPTGGPSPYPGVEANKVFELGKTDPDIDDCFIVDEAAGSIPLDTRSRSLQRLVHAYAPGSGVNLEVWSTEPAFQFYTGKYINVPEVGGVEARKARSAFCVEPSRYVNAPNVDEWKNQVLLKKGDVYGARIVYKGWSDKV